MGRRARWRAWRRWRGVGAVVLVGLLAAACNDGPWERSCEEGEGCADDESCEINLSAPGYKVSHSICAPLCEDEDDCPPPSSGNAEATCSDRGVCELRCGDGIACPSGTVCVYDRCKWPH